MEKYKKIKFSFYFLLLLNQVPTQPSVHHDHITTVSLLTASSPDQPPPSHPPSYCRTPPPHPPALHQFSAFLDYLSYSQSLVSLLSPSTRERDEGRQLGGKLRGFPEVLQQSQSSSARTMGEEIRKTRESERCKQEKGVRGWVYGDSSR